ncbi:peptidylprolyl isomerase [Novosphingobium resinovorum]|uniref:peptidylprolyl isomerase n=1 Tax=Novosphingobium TaxID=165696 RepID=UPI001B3C6095|nr:MULTISPECIES: peptidylprolyl isomerase [Novosphingobium]MBF7010560.1 peptidylprolyl isomerase [Novosphingobium sp. HR1a]WJM28560.1 peptidylprolyl isomerase [Novosphingobium resinovorum]
MKLQAALALIAVPLALSPASAQDAAPVTPAAAPAAAPAPVPAEYVYVALTVPQGVITLALDKTHAPLTTANFLKYVDTKKMDGAVFYRAMHLDHDPEQGLLQGGVRNGANLLPPVAHEPNSKTGIKHVTGTISMARFAPGSAQADFLILLSDMPSLDAEPGNDGKDPGAGFAAFGHVAAGMDVVKALWNLPRSPTKGEGVMKGQILAQDVKIITARRTKAPATGG